MHIQKIILHNFRVYKGEHHVFFPNNEIRNVHLVCGNNGYGKTTFLTALVWCLYGKQMQEVDGIYKKQISEAGGYRRFLESSLNRNVQSKAKPEDKPIFSVSLIFNDVHIPAFSCDEVEITRSFIFGAGTDQLDIKIDGQENELTQEVGPEYFINDFILPKEIAKFFFFDAEKIVSLAEMKSIEEKKRLSKAYSEVLGIKKYEDLRTNLMDMRLRFRKDSASETERKRYQQLDREVDQILDLRSHAEARINILEERKLELNIQINDLQEKLIRAGSSISLSQLKELRKDKMILEKEHYELKDQIRSMLELAPFGMAMGLMNEVRDQINLEHLAKSGQIDSDLFESRSSKFLALLKEKNLLPAEQLNDINLLLRKSFYPETNGESLTFIHGMNREETELFESIHLNLRTSYKDNLKEITKRHRRNKAQLSRVRQRLSNAESKENDEVIQRVREDKSRLDQEMAEIQAELLEKAQEVGRRTVEFASIRKVTDELGRKIRVGDLYKDKDDLAERLILKLNKFLVRLKEEKKLSLEDRILSSLKILMHKEDFIQRVEVDVSYDIIDILLFDGKDELISKDTLSKGEQQLYATAILKGLVEESNIQFPVFIDSPMQKFDGLHARKVISEFYPTISKQVVLLPLLEKELSEAEYQLLLPRTSSSYLIVHNERESSGFQKIDPNSLFHSHKNNQAHVLQH